MSGEPECPKLTPTVLAYTVEAAAARPWGIVTGTGPTPNDALRNLCHNAGEQGRQIFELLWKQSAGSASQWRDSLQVLGTQGSKSVGLTGAFSVGSTRLAYGQLEGKPCWVAYGTLMTDSTGDGTNWLQRETPASAAAGDDSGGK